MSEDEAIAEIQEHINSGKTFMLGMGFRVMPLPFTAKRFYWLDKDEGRGFLWINHPVTLVRGLSEEEVKANWWERRLGKWELRHLYYYEAILD